MNVTEAIERRRTVRDFSPQPVPREVLMRLLSSGMKAPAGGGSRPWRFVLVDDRETRRALADGFRVERSPAETAAVVDSWGVEDEDERAMYLDALPRQASMIVDAGALVIPCFEQPEPLLAEKQSLHQLNGVVSIWLCIENILLAAAEEGVFGVTKVPSTPRETENIRRVLGIPSTVEVPCYLALGYAGAAARVAARKPCEVPTSVNRWDGDS